MKNSLCNGCLVVHFVHLLHVLTLLKLLLLHCLHFAGALLCSFDNGKQNPWMWNIHVLTGWSCDETAQRMFRCCSYLAEKLKLAQLCCNSLQEGSDEKNNDMFDAHVGSWADDAELCLLWWHNLLTARFVGEQPGNLSMFPLRCVFLEYILSLVIYYYHEEMYQFWQNCSSNDI